MKLLDQLRQVARVKHYSYRTEQCYVYWAERFIRFHGISPPQKARKAAGSLPDL